MNAIQSLFEYYIGIDYSGAETPSSSLKGLRVYRAYNNTKPEEVLPPPSPRKYWTRRGLAEWLVEQLSGDTPTLVGIDHGFSFPLRYFEAHHLPPDWVNFLDDFQQYWPTDGEFMYVDFIRDGLHGNGVERMGNPHWRRIAEERCRAKSVFHFDVPGSVAKSTHAGLPWLRFLRQQLGGRLHCWPFDDWTIPPGRSVVLEAYPALYKQGLEKAERTPDQQDAYAIAAWMQQADREGTLAGYLNPNLSLQERAMAGVEGWILGVK